VTFFVAKIHHFPIYFLKSQATCSGELFGKLRKKITKEESYEIAKVCFGGFGQIFSILLFKSPYLANRL
jgi:hypothetical protein